MAEENESLMTNFNKYILPNLFKQKKFLKKQQHIFGHDNNTGIHFWFSKSKIYFFFFFSPLFLIFRISTRMQRKQSKTNEIVNEIQAST